MTYQLPKVWSAADSDQGKFSGINQPSAGARLGRRFLLVKNLFSFIRLGLLMGSR